MRSLVIVGLMGFFDGFFEVRAEKVPIAVYVLD